MQPHVKGSQRGCDPQVESHCFNSSYRVGLDFSLNRYRWKMGVSLSATEAEMRKTALVSQTDAQYLILLLGVSQTYRFVSDKQKREK